MLDIDVKMSGIDAVNAALRDAQPAVRKATVPVMEMAARSIAAAAQSFADPSTPRNLWRGKHGRALSPKYNAKQKGPYWYCVETPGGAIGKAEAMAEFSRLAVTSQGAALVSALNSRYGGTGGRILWQTADRMAADVMSSFQRAIEAAASEIEEKMGGA